MKRLIKLIKCRIVGHKWIFLYAFGTKAHIRCEKCETHKDIYIHEILELL
jgi:hypothetical protein